MTRDFDFSGFGLRLLGEDPVLAQLSEEWAAFAGAAARQVLTVTVERGELRIPPGNRLDGRVEETIRPGGGRLARVEGALEWRAGGEAVLRLHAGAPSRRLWGAINLLAQGIGRCLPAQGGLFLHAAGALVDGRAFVLAGPAGAGKTTWARACVQAGLPVLSDDLVLVDLSDDAPAALGSPLRGKDLPTPGRGRWPVAAVLLARHGPACLAPAPRLRASAVLQANAVFTRADDLHVGRCLDRLVDRVPCKVLSFAPDPSFVPLLRALVADAS